MGVVPNGSAEVLAIEMPVSTLGQFATLVKRRVDGAVLLGSVTTSAETVIAAAEAVPHVAQAASRLEPDKPSAHPAASGKVQLAVMYPENPEAMVESKAV